MGTFSHLYVFFGEMSIRFSANFFDFFFFFEPHELFVYSGGLIPCQFLICIFSHSEGCLFILFMISFVVQ